MKSGDGSPKCRLDIENEFMQIALQMRIYRASLRKTLGDAPVSETPNFES